MFNKKEIDLLKDDYFAIIRENEQFVEVMSKNTKHCWIICKKTYIPDKSISLYHKHTPKKKYYHFQSDAGTVSSAVKKIKHHDEYFLRYGETIRWMRTKGAAKYGAI